MVTMSGCLVRPRFTHTMLKEAITLSPVGVVSTVLNVRIMSVETLYETRNPVWPTKESKNIKIKTKLLSWLHKPLFLTT